ncbi:probable disease resistance protein At4g27220 [Cynara cardunculus var. scolymus]|uniref:Disease resistance protein n=1 Tax=Cynara cardunculus var. scolymus TaxID=59895 RepID=A0A103XQD9_CYNCS|nr:probable disease resistance protein At4g27220 [Cynara cardunculus var. scolymus]KVH94910.1 Disease resistance protein [Cynara cardunculus var. scolymus]
MIGLVALLDPLVTVTLKIGGWLADPIKNQYGYLFNYTTNIKKLRDGVEDLENSRASVQQSVDAALRNLQVIKPDVLAWMNGVDELKKEADEVLQASSVRVHKWLWCFGGRFHDIKSRYSRSRKAVKTMEYVLELQEKYKFNKVSDPPMPVEITDYIYFSNSEGFESRVSVRTDIMESLQDDAICVIGVCGMGGVGKTTMAKEVGVRAKGEHLFDVVVMVDVTQTPNKKTIQSSIAEHLGLKLQEESLSVRAARISARLKALTRVLVILDDIWTRLDLEELGVPLGSDGQHHGCKILLTSRSISACNQMKADKIFKIREMPENEAWLLFERTAERSFHRDPSLHQVARDIVEKCGGLPLAIVTIARALESEKDKSMWDDALQRLRSYNLEGEYASVYSSLEVTYNFLESDEMKHVFLLCCLFPESHDISIEDLLRLGLGLSLFKKTDGVSEARIRTHAFVQKLKNLNLLLDGGDELSVKLHDLVRDSGLNIASTNKHVFVVKHGDGLQFWPSELTDECCTSISLRCDEMSELPDNLNCPKLELLHLVGGNQSLEFPTGFYDVMAELKVILLRGMLIRSTSLSLEVSIKLRNLSLEYCTFDKTSDLSMIGNLVKLEILSFVHSDVKELPIEIGNLSQLKVLDLTGCGDLFNIAPGLLQRLIHLEELYMTGTLVSWPDEQTTTCIRELNSLSLLTALEIELSVYDLLPHDFIFRRLKRFKVCIGFSTESKMAQNTLTLRLPASWEADGFEILFNRTEILHLHGWRLLANSILSNPESSNFLMLRNLKLESCDMCHLTEICHGQYHETAVGEITIDEPETSWKPLFRNLHDLEIVRCVNLRSIFSLNAPTDFLKLENLKITGCEMMEEIFLKKKRDQDERSVVEIELPNLKCLILEDLPRLTGFSKDVSSLVLPQLLEFRLRNLPKFQALNIVDENRSSANHSLFDQKILATTQLKVLSISKMKMKEIQKHLLPVSCFVSLRVMSFCKCDDLSSVVLSDLLRKPKGLKLLHLEDCHLVEIVFEIQKLLTEGLPVLNNLSDLELESLPKMTHIWKHGPETFVGFQNLTKLSVASCHQLTYVLLPSIATILAHLQELSVTECQRMTVILKEGSQHEAIQATNRSDQLVFPRLKSLELIDLPSLRCFCSELHDFIWPSLETVWIDCCKEMMIFTAGTSSTPKLREIWINGTNHTIERDLNTELQWLQQQLNDGDSSDSTFRSSVIE